MKVIGGKNGSKQYSLQAVIGQGAFGKVYSSPPYAVKEMTLNVQPYLKAALTNEIAILQKLSHPNIVSLHQVIWQNNFVYLVMEYCELDLSKYIKKFKIDEKLAVHIFRQILAGFHKLVEKGIIHRDLKPANILVNSKAEFKLADFGLAKFVDHYDSKLLETIAGTPLYMAPQLLQKSNYTTKCDVWSVGVVFYQLLTGKLPWIATNQRDLLKNIMNKPLNIPPEISDWSREILLKMLVINENNRIGWDDLFKYVLKKQGDRSKSKAKDRDNSSAKERDCSSAKDKSGSSAKSQKSLQIQNKANSDKMQIISVKGEKLKLLFEIELSQLMQRQSAHRIMVDSKYRLSVEECQKVKQVLEMFVPEYQAFIRKNISAC